MLYFRDKEQMLIFSFYYLVQTQSWKVYRCLVEFCHDLDAITLFSVQIFVIC